MASAEGKINQKNVRCGTDLPQDMSIALVGQRFLEKNSEVKPGKYSDFPGDLSKII